MIKIHGELTKPQPLTKRDGKLIAVVGVQGAGKSLTMTYLAVQAYLQRETIYSNFHLYGGIEYIYLNEKEDVLKGLNGIYNSSIFADEFHAYLDAYDWRKPEVIDYVKTQMVTARRKGNKVIMGNQLKAQFPYRLRTIIPIWLLPRIKKFVTRHGRKVPYKVEVFQINKDTEEVTKWKYKAEPYLDLYDTYENFDFILTKNNEMEDQVNNILYDKLGVKK